MVDECYYPSEGTRLPLTRPLNYLSCAWGVVNGGFGLKLPRSILRVTLCYFLQLLQKFGLVIMVIIK